MPRYAPACLLATLHAVAVAVAQPSNPTDEPLELLRSATDRIVQAKAFTAEFEFAAKIGLPGLEHGRYARYQVTAARPNRLAIVRTAGDLGATVVSDGKTITKYVAELSQYTTSAAPQSLDEFSASATTMMLLEGGLGGFVMGMFAEDPCARLTTHVTDSRYLGRESIDGQPCHHLRLVQGEWDVDIWITAEGEPTLRRIRPDFSRQYEEEQRDTDFTIVISIEYENWDFDPEVPDGAFDFTPPATAEEVEELSARVPEPVTPPVVAEHPLLGQPAPEFSLPRLDGDDPVRLADHLGQQVIILDFWATWCPPCVEGLPRLAEVAKQYRSKPVRVFAVNLEENPETIRDFLDEHQIEPPPVLLDTDGSAFKQYEVSQIPQTVLIGLDGRVQAVHAGLPEEFESELIESIDALLQREDLTDREAPADNASQDDGAANRPADP